MIEELTVPDAATYRERPGALRRFADPVTTQHRAERLLAPRVALACACTFALGLSTLLSYRYLYSTLEQVGLTGALLTILLLHAPLRSSALRPVKRRARIDVAG